MTTPRKRLVRLFRSSLSARIVLLVLALLLVLQVASFWSIRASLLHNARTTLPQELAVGDRVLTSLLDQQGKALNERFRTLVNDYGFGEALATDDEATIADMLDNHGRRVGASEMMMVGIDLKVKAYHGASTRPLAALLPSLAPKLSDRPMVEPTWVDGRLLQIVVTPVPQRGWLVGATPVTGQVVTDMGLLSGTKLTVLTRAGASAPWTVALTGLEPADARALAAVRWAPDGAVAAMQEVDTHDDTLLARPHRFGAAGGALDSEPLVLAVVSASVNDALAAAQEIQRYLLVITLVGFAAFGIGSVATARYVTTPLRTLASAAERLGAGDFDTPMPRLRRSDGIGELATTFERMRHNVADKQAQVEKLAYWDTLTGLPNRVQFGHAVAAAIDAARAGGHSVAVVMLDLDRFKHVNDVLGYRLGDLLLTGLADRLKAEMVRDGDLVARLGGDEFAVLLRQGDEALAQSVAARITRAFDEPLELEEHTVDMHAGIGMACWPQHANDVETLLSRAEVAMYTAKRRTAGPLMYDASIDAGSAQTLSLLSELRHAVDHGELRLYLQPKLGLAEGEVVGAETLVRWMHPTRGMVPPMQFIPFAEQTGFIRHMTMWIFEEAARHWRTLHAEGIRLTLSVNLSTRDLLDQDLPHKFGALLLRHQVPSNAFCLEITESAIMDDPQRALTTLERLSEQGFSLSIDDFGTGYSSLAYLKRLPVDELKIDKSFVMSMETDLDDRKIVRSTIDLAHNLGLTVVAEGVENAKIWDLLRELNCDHAQGYHMGRPMPATEFGRWAEAWSVRRVPTPSAHPGAPTLLH